MQSREVNAQELSLCKRLTPHLPPGTAAMLARWAVELKVSFIVARRRKSRLGDFTPAHRGKMHRISVNGDLHPYHFLIVSLHEFAHLGCWLKHKGAVAPHGQQWKAIYARLLSGFLGKQVFPSELESAIRAHLANPPASSCTCPLLSRALLPYSTKRGELLIDLPSGSTFVFEGYSYRMLELRRTRCLCERLPDGRQFLISGKAVVLANKAA